MNNIKESKQKNLIVVDKKTDYKKKLYILILIMVISGFFGFIYETIFYKIDLGYFVKRGSTFGPWIPIYAVGGLLITIISYRLKKNPFIVFVINSNVTGLLEYVTGYVLYEYKGIRLWDYNKEIWNFGNINGYICLRSVLFFGISSLFLVYCIIPAIKKFAFGIEQNKLKAISYVLGLLFILDVIAFKVLVK